MTCCCEVIRLDGADFLEEISITDRSASMERVAAATGEGASAIASVHKAIGGLV
jgi:hypothetical protein